LNHYWHIGNNKEEEDTQERAKKGKMQGMGVGSSIVEKNLIKTLQEIDLPRKGLGFGRGRGEKEQEMRGGQTKTRSH